MSLPAILGGKSAFPEGLPYLRISLPKFQDVVEKLKKVWNTGMLTKGEYRDEYEEKLKNYLKVENVISVSSCTLGLVLTLQALSLEGEILIPSFTFSATASAVWWNKLRILWVDCDPESFGISLEDLKQKITPATKAILATHIFGNPLPIEELQNIANQHSLFLVFDSAHAMGSLYCDNPLGGFGDAEVFSTSPTKLLITGEGGFVTTRNPEIAWKIKVGREYGNPGDYNCLFAGLNARLTEFQALLGILGLDTLEKRVGRRNYLVSLYKRHLEGSYGISFQRINPLGRSSYKDFAILIAEDEFGLSRDQLAFALEKEGIETKRYFSPPCHLQKAYNKVDSLYLPNTEKLANQVLCLPIYERLEDREVELVCKTILNIQAKAPKIRRLLVK